MRPPYDPNDWTTLLDGPVFRDRTARLALADAVAARVQAYYGANLLFCALYGSLARQADGPFSDVELFCALSTGPDSCRVYEWIEAGIKCKLRVYTEAALTEETARVDAEWPLSHNKIFHHRLLVGSPEPLGRLHSLACAAGDVVFSTVITQLYIAEVFELTAKLYNLGQHPGPEDSGAGPVLIRLLEQVAIIVGMAERRCFSTRARMLNEAVSWGTLSGAFPELCACALHGRWQDMKKILHLLETLWNELRLFLLQRQLLLSTAIQPF